MTEYWQSKKQYWCKFCSIFIRDDAPSRSLHENGLKHQGNKERALRQLYKTGEHAKREKEQEKKMMERIERDALAAHRAAGGTGPPPSAAAGPSKPAASRAKPTDPYVNYSTAASLGYADADAAWQAEADKIKAQKREQGVVGGWETVAVAPPAIEEAVPEGDLKPGTDADATDSVTDAAAAEPGAEAGPSRTTALRTIKGTLDEPDSAEAHNFRFGTAVKRPDEDLHDDLDALEARMRARELAARRPVADEAKGGWIKAEAGATESVDVPADVKAEAGHDEVKPEVKAEAVGEDVKPSTGGGMFKKRKAPGGANRSVRQKV